MEQIDNKQKQNISKISCLLTSAHSNSFTYFSTFFWRNVINIEKNIRWIITTIMNVNNFDLDKPFPSWIPPLVSGS